MNERRAREEADLSKKEMKKTLSHLKRLHGETRFPEIRALHAEAVQRFRPILQVSLGLESHLLPGVTWTIRDFREWVKITMI